MALTPNDLKNVDFTSDEQLENGTNLQSAPSTLPHTTSSNSSCSTIIATIGSNNSEANNSLTLSLQPELIENVQRSLALHSSKTKSLSETNGTELWVQRLESKYRFYFRFILLFLFEILLFPRNFRLFPPSVSSFFALFSIFFKLFCFKPSVV